jgi:transposase-like protein
LKEWNGGWFHLRQRFVMCPRCAAFNVSRATSGLRNEFVFQCFPCDYNTPSGSGNPIEGGLIAPSTPHKGELLIEQEDVKVYIDKIEEAYKRARSFRF